MARQVKVSIEVETGQRITHYRSLLIEQDIYRHHRFEIVVPFEALENENETFFNRSHKDLCGKGITVTFEPLVKTGTLDFQFKAVITEIALSNQSDMSNVFILKGYGFTILLEDIKQRRTFLNRNLQQIFSTVLDPYPGNVLKKQLNPLRRKQIRYAVQYDETNFQFLNRMAADSGEWFYYDGTQLLLGKPDDAKEVEFLIDGIQSFDMSVALKPLKFQMSAYDYTTDQTYRASSCNQQADGSGRFGKFALDESETLFNNEALLLADVPRYNQDELNEHASACRSGIAGSLIVFQGRGENPAISIGTVINVNGTRPQKGGRGSKENFGKFLVIEITHTVDSGGNYSASFKAVPETIKNPPLNPHVNRTPGQLELATVIDNNDPDGLSRVKVAFHWPGRNNQSDWIRVGSFYSGGADGKGMQFIPEKDAQVVIGYEQNRPERPFIITSLYPKKEGMRSLQGNNEQKMIYTKAGNLIELNDKERENKIYITNVNKADTSICLEFKDNGIISLVTNGNVQIEAQETVSINAQQKITLEAQDIELKAQNNLSCEGLQVKIEAQTSAEIKAGTQAKMGGLTTEVKSDTILTIEGTLVKIN